MSLHPDWIVLTLALAAVAASVLLLVRTRDRRTWLRRLGMALAFAAIAVRPVFGAEGSAGRMSNLDVVLLVDRTTSMAAEDYNGNDIRLIGVQHDVREIVTQFVGARFVLITFDNSARVELPPTTDTTAVVTMADAMSYLDPTYGSGSSISVGLPEAERVLDTMAEESPGRQRMLIYLGDGEQTVAEPPDSFAPLAAKIDAAAVLGYGTASGGRMKYSKDYDSYVYNRDGGGDAISRIDEAALQTIADDLGGQYQHRTEPNPLTLNGPDQGFAALSGGEVSGGVDLSWVFATVLVGLGLWEAWLVAGRYRQLRRGL